MVQRRASLAPDLKRKSALWVMTRKRKDTYRFQSFEAVRGKWAMVGMGSRGAAGRAREEEREAVRREEKGKGKGDVEVAEVRRFEGVGALEGVIAQPL